MSNWLFYLNEVISSCMFEKSLEIKVTFQLLTGDNREINDDKKIKKLHLSDRRKKFSMYVK